MKKLLTLLFTLMVAWAFAQTPQGISYQGVATDANGLELINQAISIRATVLSGSANGANQYQEAHATTTDQFGLFTITIGQGSNTGVGATTFANISWGANSHFLKIEMDATGGTSYMLMGTNQMLSVPYALYAESTDNVDDADADSTNELQILALSNDTLFLSSGGYAVLNSFTNTDNQTLTVNGDSISISNGNTIVIQDNTIDGDADPTNELQILSLSNDTLYLSAGGFVVLNSFTNTDNQTLNLSNDTLSISGGNSVILESIDYDSIANLVLADSTFLVNITSQIGNFGNIIDVYGVNSPTYGVETQAVEDGFLYGILYSSDNGVGPHHITLYYDSIPGTSTMVAKSTASASNSSAGGNSSFCVPIKKDYYWRFEKNGTAYASKVYWIPLNSGASNNSGNGSGGSNSTSTTSSPGGVITINDHCFDAENIITIPGSIVIGEYTSGLGNNFNSIDFDSLNNLYVIYQESAYNSVNWHVSKYDTSGSLVWDKLIILPSWRGLYTLKVKGNYVYFTGTCYNGNGNNSNPASFGSVTIDGVSASGCGFIAKINLTGSVQWINSIGGSCNGTFNIYAAYGNFDVDNQDNVYIENCNSAGNINNVNCEISVFNSAGVLQPSIYTFTNSYSRFFYDLAVSDNSVFISRLALQNNSPTVYFYDINKTSGNINWSTSNNTTSQLEPNGSGGVFAAHKNVYDFNSSGSNTSSFGVSHYANILTQQPGGNPNLPDLSTISLGYFQHMKKVNSSLYFMFPYGGKITAGGGQVVMESLNGFGKNSAAIIETDLQFNVIDAFNFNPIGTATIRAWGVSDSGRKAIMFSGTSICVNGTVYPSSGTSSYIIVVN